MTKTFRELGVDPALCDALEERDITHPFPIQELTLPLALDGHDLIGQARTGTGKTFAFGLPLLQRVDASKKHTQALVIVPTRELCLQVHADLKVGNGKGLSTLSVYGGVGYDDQINALNKGAQVVVGTPGRLLDLFNRGDLDLSQVTQLVLDEADEMLDMGFLPDVERLVEACTGDDRHTMLFSATMPTAIVKLARRYMNHPTFTRADHEQKNTAPQVTQHFFQVHRMDKPRLLARILQDEGRGGVFVFVRTKHMADRLVNDLQDLKVPSIAIHGDLRQQTREKNLEQFRSGKATVLVCTEVAARGLDISGVTHVVNYDCPDDEKMYLHRIGRTARAGESGVAVTFAEFNEIDRLNVIRKAVAATDTEVEQVFSTSKLLEERFNLPAERPWDHLKSSSSGDTGSKRSNGRGKSSNDRREKASGDRRGKNPTGTRDKTSARTKTSANGGGKPSGQARDKASDDTRSKRSDDGTGRSGRRRGSADGRSKNSRASEGCGGAHDADRRSRSNGSGTTIRNSETDAHESSTESRTRTRTRTRTRDTVRADSQPQTTRGRSSSGDRTSPGTRTSSSRRTRARGGARVGDRTQASRPDTGRNRSMRRAADEDRGAKDSDAAGPARAGRNDRSKRDRPGNDDSRPRARRTRARGGHNVRARQDGHRSGDEHANGQQTKRSDPKGGPTGGGNRGNRNDRTNRNSRNERKAGHGRGNDRDGRTGRNDQRKSSAKRRRGGQKRDERQPAQAGSAPAPVARRGAEARGDGKPSSTRRVKVEHLP